MTEKEPNALNVKCRSNGYESELSRRSGEIPKIHGTVVLGTVHKNFSTRLVILAVLLICQDILASTTMRENLADVSKAASNLRNDNLRTDKLRNRKQNGIGGTLATVYAKAYVITKHNNINTTLEYSLMQNGFMPYLVDAVRPDDSFKSKDDFVNYCFGGGVSDPDSIMAMSLGEIALLGSHRKALQLVANDQSTSDGDWALILEDDARFVPPPDVTHKILSNFFSHQRMNSMIDIVSSVPRASYGFAYFGLCNPFCERTSPDGFFGSGCQGWCTHAYAVTKYRARTFFKEVYCLNSEDVTDIEGIICGKDCSTMMCHTDQAFVRHFLTHKPMGDDHAAVNALLVGPNFTSPDEPSHKGLMYQCCRNEKVIDKGSSLTKIDFLFQNTSRCYRLSPSGRFGNLMFQYAALIGMCTNKRSAVAQCASLAVASTHKSILELQYFVDTFDLVSFNCHSNGIYYSTPTVAFDSRLLNKPFGTTISGNMQSWRYFHPHAQGQVLRTLSFPVKVTRRVDKWLGSLRGKPTPTWLQQVRRLVCVHLQLAEKRVRVHHRSRHHFSLSTDYYTKSIDLLLRRHGSDGMSLVFFIDSERTGQVKDMKDRLWAQRNLTDKYAKTLAGAVHFKFGDPSAESMYAMSRCDSIVMSYDSLSWWSAYLAESERGIFDRKGLVSGVDVIAPKYSLAHPTHYVPKDYYFPHWILV